MLNHNEVNLALSEAAKKYYAGASAYEKCQLHTSTPEEIKQAFATAMRKPHHEKKLEFSKRLMIVASVLCSGTWIASALAWFIWREFPYDLVQYTVWFYGATFALYMAKACYENKLKIKSNGGQF